MVLTQFAVGMEFEGLRCRSDQDLLIPVRHVLITVLQQHVIAAVKKVVRLSVGHKGNDLDHYLKYCS